MLEIWQNLPQKIDPIALSIGPLDIRWYSISYLLAFSTVYLLIRREIKRRKPHPFTEGEKETIIQLDNLFLWLIIGLLIGARSGFIIFYSFFDFLTDPISFLSPFGNNSFGFSGMSYHGGLIGILLTATLFTKKYKINFWQLVNFITPAIPLGYFWGRIGNFLGGELYGRTTDFILGMDFPATNENSLRHPSQLYEAFFEGIFIFSILWSLRHYPKLKNKLFPLYLILYGVIRFVIEFFREPDAGVSLTAELTRGQLLSSAMILIGTILLNTITNKNSKSL